MIEFLTLALETFFASRWVMWWTFMAGYGVMYIVLTRWWVSHQGKKAKTDHLRGKFEALTPSITPTIHQTYQEPWGLSSPLISKMYHAYTFARPSYCWNRESGIFVITSAILLFFLVWWVGSVFLGVVITGSFVGLFLGILLLKGSYERKQIVERIPGFLRGLSGALQAGYSLPTALSFVAQEIPSPLKEEIHTINQKLELQIPLEKALGDFADHIRHPDVDFFVESTLIQIRSGGNLVALFQKISHLIEEKLKLERDIKSFTSQGKLSGILIAALWPLSLLFFSSFSPQHIEILFYTPLGKTMLAMSLLLEMVGFYWIWKIVQART